MEKNKGLSQKYIVERIDGNKIKDGCIVLEFKDENSRVGIKAFSEKVRQEGFVFLADDLDNKLEEYK